MTEETGLEYRCHAYEKVYGFIASEQIKNGMRPVQISQRWAMLWLKISGRTWRRSTQHLSSLGYVGRHIIRGRGRGSIYWIDWKSANSLAELYSKPNGYMAKHIGHKARKNGHLDPLMNTRNRPLIRELRPLLQYEKSAKMNPIPPNGGNQAPSPGRTPPEEGRTAPKTSLKGRQLINVSLSPDIFEAAQADEELLQMCLTRGMIRLSASPVSQADTKAGSAFDTAKAIVTDALKTKGERYLEVLAAKDAANGLAKAERLVGHVIENQSVELVRCDGCGWETLHVGMGYRLVRGSGKRGSEMKVATVPCHCGGQLVLVDCIFKPEKESDSEP